MQACETNSKGRMILLFIWFICISKSAPASIFIAENNDGSPYGTEAAGDSPTGSLYHRAFEYGVKLWPQGKVIYDVDESINEPEYRARIDLTAQAMSNATCIKFIKRTRENEMLPYVSIRRYKLDGNKSCESEIGFLNLHPQEIILTPDYCTSKVTTKFVGILAHEFVHTLGFVHEFERTDRDAYLTVPVINGEMPPKIPGNTANLTFDFKSIMTYAASHGFKAVNPRPAGYPPPIGTISDMGHVCKLSASDRTLIDRIYAKECKLKHPEKIAYKNDWPLPTGACEGTIDYMKDEDMH